MVRLYCAIGSRCDNRSARDGRIVILFHNTVYACASSRAGCGGGRHRTEGRLVIHRNLNLKISLRTDDNFIVLDGHVPYWDKGLHLLSGALLGGFAFSAFGALVPEDAIAKISPFFIGMYSVAFAVFCGVLWEFYEFTCDSFGMNLQRYMQAGRPLVGRAALMDTMGDLFADFIGALLFAVVAYLQLKKNRNWLKTFFFKRIEQK